MGTKIKLFVAQVLITLVIYALPLFLAAGVRLWPAGWAFLALWFGFWAALLLWLSRHDPALFQERMNVSAANQQRWDKVLEPLFYLTLFTWLLFMAFDAARWHWSPMPHWLQMIGALILLCSFYLYFLTFRENSYLSTQVRVQEERGQTVISTGPYHYVRHPMYAATVVFVVGTPLLLGAWLGLPLGLIVLLVLARRAVLEELALKQELVGYGDYMAQVKYRLVPYIW
jgi:protein-S-isoprenylcysteine O-methyltransferase Ste14